jgi:hypothetical protein
MARRSQQDRRCRAGRTKFPFRDSGGELVSEDRRCLPDRRLSGIEVEWLEMACESGHEPLPPETLWNRREG